jgi:hypothetical protein
MYAALLVALMPELICTKLAVIVDAVDDTCDNANASELAVALFTMR